MSPFWVLVKLRLMDVFRRPASGFFILILPVALIIVIGGMFANGHPFERRRISVVAAPAESARSLSRLPGVRVLEAPNRAFAEGALQSRMTDAVVLFSPTGSSEARLLVRSQDELFGRGLAEALEGHTQAVSNPDGAGEMAGASPKVKRDVTMEMVAAPRWGYLHYLVPGMLALAVVLSGFYGMGTTMVRYRATQFLKKLSTTPLSKSTFVAAQITARTLIVLAQTVLMLLSAHLVFGLPLTAVSFGLLCALATLGLFTFMGAGFALASVIRTEGHIEDVINALTGPLVLLSEVFFSAEELPQPLPLIASALPSTQLVRLSRAILLSGESRPLALLPGTLIVIGWLVAMFVISRLVFRWSE